jgi:hypothetical protein
MGSVRQVRLAGRSTTKKRSTKSHGLDPKKDFSEPTHKEPEQMTAEELKAHNELAEMPSTIVKGFMAASYVKPHFDVEKDDRTAALEFSLELTDNHRSLLPKKVVEEWDHIKQGNNELLDVVNVGAQHVEVSLDPGDEVDLEENVPIERIRLQVIETKGTGDAKDIIRLSFRLVCDLTQDVERFACRNFGKTVWLKMQACQGELL